MGTRKWQERWDAESAEMEAKESRPTTASRVGTAFAVAFMLILLGGMLAVVVCLWRLAIGG